MRRSATHQRDRDVAATRLKGKIETGDHDVFLCYSSPDRDRVVAVAGQLKERGILPWLDVWDLRPGTRWQGELADRLSKIRSVAVFVGPGRTRPWQEIELETRCPSSVGAVSRSSRSCSTGSVARRHSRRSCDFGSRSTCASRSPTRSTG
jgi:hypothetical protein